MSVVDPKLETARMRDKLHRTGGSNGRSPRIQAGVPDFNSAANPNGESVGSLSDRYKIKRSVLYRWRDLLRDQGVDGFHRPRGPKSGQMKPVVGASASSEQRIAELEQRLGRLALENDFLRRAFRRVKAARSQSTTRLAKRVVRRSDAA